MGFAGISSFSGSGTAAGADRARLTGIASGELVEINLVIGGPTTSDDLYSFAFDLVMSAPDVFELVPGSAALGPALRQCIAAHAGTYTEVLAVHFEKHLRALQAGC